MVNMRIDTDMAMDMVTATDMVIVMVIVMVRNQRNVKRNPMINHGIAYNYNL